MQDFNLNEKVKELGALFNAITSFSLILYIIGFFIWNIFLFSFRFNEIQVLQTRFIYTGFFFVVFCLFWISIIGIIIFLIDKFVVTFTLNAKFKSFLVIKWVRGLIIFFALILISFLVFLYTLYYFPRTSRLLGGGRPTALSFMVNSESGMTLQYLSKFGIIKAEGSEEQTQHLCIAYENSDRYLVVLPDRVVFLDKSKFNGTMVLLSKNARAYEEGPCTSLVGYWLLSGNGLKDYGFISKLFGWVYNFELKDR